MRQIAVVGIFSAGTAAIHAKELGRRWEAVLHVFVAVGLFVVLIGGDQC